MALMVTSSSINSELGAAASLSVVSEKAPAKPSFFESCWRMLCCCSCTSPPIQGRQVTVQASSALRPLTPTPPPQPSEPPSSRDLLRDTRHVRALTRYAQDTYTSENVQFLQAFRALSSQSNQAQIKKVIDKFIRDEAPLQVNISGKLRQQIVDAEYTVAHILLFEAETEVTNIMKDALMMSGVRLTIYDDLYVS